GPRRFTDLRDGLPGIATNLLSDRLQRLQDDGLISRRELPAPAASTVYELTEAGRGLRGVVQELIRWGGRWMLSGRGEDAFRTGWLVLALDALGLSAEENKSLLVRLETAGEAVSIRLDRDGVTEVDSVKDADLVVRGDPEVILGLAAGELSLDEASKALSLQPAGAGGRRRLKRAFSPSGSH
ncbi:MAG: helix-turn-helix domain-containing protein, partial [Longimicrobiales bacterium]|nr:helix-turn-helix domain-containing protein [Longimicrobiales bacterium]